MWINAKEAARYDAGAESWKKRAGWMEFEHHWNSTWEQLMCRYDEAMAVTT